MSTGEEPQEQTLKRNLLKRMILLTVPSSNPRAGNRPAGVRPLLSFQPATGTVIN